MKKIIILFLGNGLTDLKILELKGQRSRNLLFLDRFLFISSVCRNIDELNQNDREHELQSRSMQAWNFIWILPFFWN